MRVIRRSDHNRQQIPRRIDEVRPELDERKIVQERKMLFEPPDNARDESVIVVGLFQICGYAVPPPTRRRLSPVSRK